MDEPGTLLAGTLWFEGELSDEGIGLLRAWNGDI